MFMFAVRVFSHSEQYVSWRIPPEARPPRSARALCTHPAPAIRLAGWGIPEILWACRPRHFQITPGGTPVLPELHYGIMGV